MRELNANDDSEASEADEVLVVKRKDHTLAEVAAKPKPTKKDLDMQKKKYRLKVGRKGEHMRFDEEGNVCLCLVSHTLHSNLVAFLATGPASWLGRT